MTTKVHELDLSTGDVVLDQGVTALAVDSSSTYCAVARDNGSIQVYGLKTHFSLEMVLTAKDNKKNVRGLVWLGDDGSERSFPRLLSFGLDGYLREWDLMRQRERWVLDTYGGAVWCGVLASPVDTANSLLALGCEDGTARLFEIPEDDEPVYTRAYSCVGKKVRVMSLCWNEKGTELYAGCSTGIIQMFRRSEQGPFQRINLEKSHQGYTPIVHDLAILPDGLLASASSHGRVTFWDPKFGTLIRSFKTHKANVLALCAATIEGNSVLFAGGVDPKIVRFNCRDDGTWGDSITSTTNHCDVWALQVFSRSLGKVNGKEAYKVQLISGNSGGVVTIFNPLRSRFRQLSRFYPIPGLVMFKDGKEVLMMTSGTSSINLWGVKGKEPTFLLRLNPSMGRGIKLTALCGKWIAVGDGEIVKIWSFELLPGEKVEVKKLCAVKKRATAISFTTNAQGLLIGQASGQVSCLDLTREFEGKKTTPEEALKPLFKIEEPVKQVINSGASYTCALGIFGSITLFCRGSTSNIPDNKVSNRVTDTLLFHAYIPTQLFCIHTDRTFRIWNLDRMKESSWSETQSSSIQHTQFAKAYFGHPVIGLAFHPSERGRVVLACPEFFSPVDLSKPLPPPENRTHEKRNNKKRRLGGANASSQSKRLATNTPSPNANGSPTGSGKRHEELKKSIRNPFEARAASDASGRVRRKDMTLMTGYQFLMGACFRGNGDLILPKVPWPKYHQYYPRRSVSTKYGT